MAGFADDLRRIPMSQGLGATLARAADYAQAQGHGQVALEHLLLALTEDDDAMQVLAASHVDLALLKADVSQFLGSIDGGAGSEEAGKVQLATDLKRILEAAAAAASQGRRREINGAIVLAAIVGDGRSSAAHMLRAQGLTFEEAIKALQRALAASAPAASLPAPAPAATPVAAAVKAETAGPGKADAEDILATARARVQTRAAPGLPPPAPRPEPAPVVLPAVVAAPVAVAEPEPEPAAEEAKGKPDFDTVERAAETAPWPPEVRRSGSPDLDALHRELEEARLEAEEAARRVNAEAEAAAYEAASHGAAAPAPAYQEPVNRAVPAGPPALAPARSMPQPGSRWPAPVAPAWRDQPAAAGGYQTAAAAVAPVPPPVPVTEPMMGPPPLPVAPMPPEYAPAEYPPAPDWGHAEAVQTWPGQHVPHEGYHDAPQHIHPAEPDYIPVQFDPGHGFGPPPMPWPGEQVPGAMAGFDAVQSYDGGPPPMNGGAGGAYYPSWPHQEATPPAAAPWPEPSLQPEPYHDGVGAAVPIPAGGMGASGGQAVAKGSRRRKADRATAGQLGESIPRRMRAHVASAVDVRLAHSEMMSLLEGLSEDGGRVVALGSVSVKLRAPDGRVLIEAVSPETQWLRDEGGTLDSAGASWRWTVTPLKAGRRRLQLAVWARTASADGTSIVTPLPDQTIEVRVGRNFGRGLGRLTWWAALIGAGWLAATYGGAVYGPVMDEVMKLLK